jgi:hypothetical protein
MNSWEGGETTGAGTQHGKESRVYAIRVKGHLEAHWSAWFDGMVLSQESDGTTVIQGAVPDQSALHGLLQKVRDLGLNLISVVRLQSE